MSHQSDLIASDIEAYLKSQEHKSLLRFITCGSVDDGKSTLIGRLLYESHLIYEDQLAALEDDSKKVGTQGDQLDFALLVDGLAAEREQGITIDVAYRYFSTDKRKFIVADTPGHEQYTRNMATGASTADLALLMVDARKGILTQTKRHSTIVSMLGVKHILLVVNKMDLVDFKESIFDEIKQAYVEFSKKVGVDAFEAIPVSALNGDNITGLSNNMPWYKGKNLIEFLETVSVNQDFKEEPFSMPIQWVNRPHLNFRGFAGQICTGKITVGDCITVLPANTTTTVKSIVMMDGDLNNAIAGQSITLTFDDEIDASRGDVIVSKDHQVNIGHEFETKLLWMSEEALVSGKSYLVKFRAKILNASFNKPNHKIDVNTLKHCDTQTLELNEIGICQLNLDQDIVFDIYQNNHDLGSFIIIDRLTNNTVGMGLVEKSLSEVKWVDYYINQRDKYWEKGNLLPSDRQKKYGHQPCLVILTGEKSDNYTAIAKQCEKDLFNSGINVYRYGFRYMGHAISGNMDVSYDEFRQDMIKNLIEIGHAFCDAGFVFITSISHLSNHECDIVDKIIAPYKSLVLDVKKSDSSGFLDIILDAI